MEELDYYVANLEGNDYLRILLDAAEEFERGQLFPCSCR